MNFVSNLIWNSVEGFMEAGTRTAGGYAGDALIKAGDMIENGGRGVGGRIERAASGYGTKISGQPSTSSTSKPRPGAPVKRSNSSPASTKAGSKVPLGGKKYPGPAGTTQKSLGGLAGGAQKSLSGGGGLQKSATSALSGAQKTTGGAGIQKGVGIVGSGAKALPKPFPQSKPNTNAPSSKTSSATNKSPYPGSEKKTPVSAYMPKPFVPPAGPQQSQQKSAGGKPGSGAKPNYPGAGAKTPVKARQFKPMPRLQGTAERGKVEHIAV